MTNMYSTVTRGVTRILLLAACLSATRTLADVAAVVESVERLPRTQRLAAYEAAMVRPGISEADRVVLIRAFSRHAKRLSPHHGPTSYRFDPSRWFAILNYGFNTDPTGLDAGSLDQIMVRATANHNGIEIEKTEATVAGDEIKITNVTAKSNGKFHNKVDYLPSFQLAWQVSLDKGANWIDAGESSTAVYLTHKDPQTSPLYHTLVHLGSTNGKNATDHDNEAEVLDAIWQKFEGLQIHAVAYNPSTGTIVQGPLLKYWHAGINTQMGPSTASLLQHADGRCQPWANFFVNVVQAQGIAGYQVVEVPPLPNTTHLLVKNWEFIGNGSLAQQPIGALGFKYLLIDPPDGGDYPNDDLNKVAGIKGQGDNDNPPSIFMNHALVLYSAPGQTRYYDPSYGLGPYDTLADWGIDALAGLAIIGGQHPDLPPGHVRFAVKKL